MSIAIKNHTCLVKIDTKGNYVFKYGDNYGWIIMERKGEIPDYLGGQSAIYELFPIHWINDNDYEIVLNKFPSFPAVMSYLTEIETMKLIIRLKEEITMYGKR